MTSGWRAGYVGLLLAASVVYGLLIGTAPVLAAGSHIPSLSFGSPGTGAGQVSLATNSGVAVNTSTHDVYVADTENHRVDEFDSSGSFIRAWGWGVGDGIGAEPQTCTLTCFAGLAGSEAGQFEAPTYIAVDNDPSSPSVGDVYVADTGDRLVTKFDATGNIVAAWGDHENAKEEPEPNGQLSGKASPGGPFLNEFGSSFAGIAVDTLGDLWVYTTNSRMVEFDQADGVLREWGGPGAMPAGIAVDGAQNVYVDSGFEQIEKLTSEGASLGALTAVPNGSNGVKPPTGLAVDQLRGDVYVDTGSNVVSISRSCNPFAGLCPAQDIFGSHELSAGAGVAVDPSTAEVFVADQAAGVIDTFAQALEVVTGPSSGVTAATATLSGTVDPEGSSVTACEFEYGETEEYGKVAPCVPPPVLSEPTAVQAQIDGLHGGTAYHYRLIAKNPAGGAVHGEDQVFTTPTTAIIAATSATNLTGGSAELQATVNPVGLPVTSCLVEYGTSSAYGLTVPCEQTPAEIGSGNSPVPVDVRLEGLVADTTYHWRLLVIDENGTSESPDQTFVYSTASASLPDGRQYEMVTPVQKNGAVIGKLFVFIPAQISNDGSRVIAATDQCFPNATSCVGNRQSEGSPYAFTRASTGWTNHPLAAPATVFPTSSYWSFNASADTALFSIPGPPAGQDDFYAREPNGTFVDLGPVGEGPELGNYSNLAKEGVMSTADLSHVAFETVAPAWAFDETNPGFASLYEYPSSTSGRPQLVGVSGGAGSESLISRCGTALGNREQGVGKRFRSLSESGRVVFFSSNPCGSGSGANEGVEVPATELYARIDGEKTDAHSVLLSGPTAGSCTTVECEENTGTAKQAERARDAAFEGASTDGSTVVFTDTQQLTDSATQDPAPGDNAFNCASTTSEGSGCNLYASICQYPCAQPSSERQLIDVSADAQDGPQVQAVVAISPNASHIYFVAKGTLSEVPNKFGQRAHGGAENLYVYERDDVFPQGRIAFIAALAPSDVESHGIANVTSNGKRLVFLSRRGLTPDATRAEGPSQVYEYDDETGALTRLSVGQAGFNNNGNAGVGDASIAPFLDVDGASSVPQRSDPTMSDDGSFVFFQSPVALTPQALDDVVVGSLGFEPLYAQNVYEYHDGQVSLISDGKDVSGGVGFPPRNVELLGSDISGANVFFTTASPLVTEDTDTQTDIYDAHICSAELPCIPSQPPPTQPCDGEACHGVAEPQPSQQTPGSATFSGAGNLPPGMVTPAKSKRLTRAQKLAKALKACRAKKNKHKRIQCEGQARRRYGVAHRAAKKRSNVSHTRGK